MAFALDDMSLDRGNASGRATRALMIRIAEELFAERGIEAVSLREIGQRAGQRNNAAAQYHFGSKQGLVETIFITRSQSIERRRRELLDELGGPLEDLDASALFRIVLQPHIETLSRPDHHFVGFVARLLTDNGQMVNFDPTRVLRFQVAHERLKRELHARLSGAVDEATFTIRYDRAFGWAIHTLAELDVAQREIDEGEIDELIGMVVRALG